MATTLDQIVKYLSKIGNNFTQEGDVIVFITGNPERTLVHNIKLKEDSGLLFEWRMQILDKGEILKIKEHKYLNKLLSYMLFINYSTKFGTWEYNPSDGEIRLAVEIPLEDAIMTEKQFRRILSLMVIDSEKFVEEIYMILETGNTPKEDDEEFKSFLKMVAKAMEETLEEGMKDSSEV